MCAGNFYNGVTDIHTTIKWFISSAPKSCGHENAAIGINVQVRERWNLLPQVLS